MPDRFIPLNTKPSLRGMTLRTVEEEGITPQASAYRLRQQLEIRAVEHALEHKEIRGTKSIQLPW